MVDSVLEVQNIKLPDSGGVTSSNAITLDASGNTTATLSSSSNIKAPLNASGDAPVYACRAWVNFDGTSGSGTGSYDITIRGSGNVSSITDNGTGQYTVNFTTAMPDVNYCISVSANPTTSSGGIPFSGLLYSSATTSSARVITTRSAAYDDSEAICVAIFR